MLAFVDFDASEASVLAVTAADYKAGARKGPHKAVLTVLSLELGTTHHDNLRKFALKLAFCYLDGSKGSLTR